MAVLKTKTDLLNAAQDVELKLREEFVKEKESHVVDVQNVTTNMAADIKRLEWEKEELQKRKMTWLISSKLRRGNSFKLTWRSRCSRKTPLQNSPKVFALPKHKFCRRTWRLTSLELTDLQKF